MAKYQNLLVTIDPPIEMINPHCGGRCIWLGAMADALKLSLLSMISPTR